MVWTMFNGGSSDRLLLPTEAAYVAGFIDGEGTLTIGRATRSERDSRAGFSYEALLTISNTDLDALKRIAAMLGNGKIQVSDKRKVLGHKPAYRILLTPNQIRHVLPQIRPYLLVKARQADVLAMFLATKASGRNVTAESWQQWENWRAEIRTLNKRGLDQTPVAPDGAYLPERLTVRPDKRRERGFRPCGVEGCKRVHYGRGYCWIHYRKFIVRGGPKNYSKTCVVCGVEYVSKRVNAECCSRKCIDQRYYRANAERIKAQVKANKERKKAVDG